MKKVKKKISKMADHDGLVKLCSRLDIFVDKGTKVQWRKNHIIKCNKKLFWPKAYYVMICDGVIKKKIDQNLVK